MSRFSPCRSLTLEGVCAECACECAMRFHGLMNPGTVSCQELYVTGQNVATYPGFEGLTTGYVIPNWDDGDASVGWVQEGSQVPPPYPSWQVSSLNSDTGSRHGRGLHEGLGPDYLFPELVLCLQRACNPAGALLADFNGMISGIVAGGDLVTFTYRAEAPGYGGSGNAYTRSLLAYYTAAGSSLTGLTYQHPVEPIGSMYQTYSVSHVAPANAHFVVARIDYYTGSSFPGINLDVDNASLVIS